MKHHRLTETTNSQYVLSIKAKDVPPFVGRCLKERSLSTLVSDLNTDILFGTPREREDAHKALKHIGFI